MNSRSPKIDQPKDSVPIASSRISKSQITKILFFLPVLLIAPATSAADTLQVSIMTSVSENLPDVTERIVRALSKTDLDINIDYLPNKRSLSLLNQGKIALEFFRTPSVMFQNHDLIKLQPPIQSLKFKMVTSIKNPENCMASESDYSNMSVAGVLGVRLHQVHFYPKFESQTTVGDVRATAQFVALQRADVSFIPEEALATVSEEIMAGLVVCDNHFKTFDFHAHLHKDFFWTKEKLGEALFAEFGR
jgi:hypothetical protein